MDTKALKDKSRLTRSELIFLIAAAIVTITVVSTCSPLYPFNPWDDANCFFTMGRGIIRGLVPYRDLYEQKGPVLYFIYAAAALISDKTFVGAWIFECIAASVFAVFSWKTAKLFTEPSGYTIFLAPVLLAVTYTIKMFNFGGNAEELCFPLLSAAMYFALRSIVINRKLPSNTEALVCGIITAVLFWIKYTFTGFMAGFVICVIFFSVKQKEFKKLWSLVWRFTAGFLLVTAPVLIYFAVNNAISYLWEAYFYNNIFLYFGTAETRSLESIPVIKLIYVPLYCFVKTTENYPAYGVLMIASVISLFFAGKEHRKRLLFMFAATLVFAMETTFTKTTIIYYYGYILSYSFAFVLIPLIKGLNRLETSYKKDPKFIKLLILGFLSVTFIFFLANCKNLYLILKPKNFLSQFRIAETINQTPDAKILTYDVMDSGFYTAAGLMPQNRFFCYLNIEENYSAIREEQDRLVREGYFDYIVTTYFFNYDLENYELVQEESSVYIDFTGEGILDGYKLYKRI